MLELSRHGAKVLHWQSVALAMRHGLSLSIRSAAGKALGSRVGPAEAGADRGEVTAITARAETRAVSRISLIINTVAAGERAVSEKAAFLLENEGIGPIEVEAAEGRVSIRVASGMAAAAIRLLHRNLIEGLSTPHWETLEPLSYCRSMADAVIY